MGLLKSIVIYSYHHVLKSMWLDRKWNCRADHLIYMLKEKMLPYFETCHNSQELRFEGSNLAKKCCKEFLQDHQRSLLNLFVCRKTVTAITCNQ